ncbi:MAG: Na+/H+ antiporter NhaC family protein [Actinomycetaceae bacterium]|nr:Na+/H+ antiporter NhaC family protein [Actinomycetaceae bacterium]
MNAVLIAVILMLVLALARVHVVLALFIGALVGGFLGGLGLDGTLLAFQDGLAGGAKIALSYALLGAFAMAVAESGLPNLLALKLISRMKSASYASGGSGSGFLSEGGAQHAEATKLPFKPESAVATTKWLMVGGILLMAVFSQNLIPVHIAFIPLLIPPLLSVMNKMQLDRRLVASVLTFGLVTTYMFIPVGFGQIYLQNILLSNIQQAGLDVANVNVMQAMAIPAAGMLVGLLWAIFVSYRRPRKYNDLPIEGLSAEPEISNYRIVWAVIAIVSVFAIQVVMGMLGLKADALLVGALVGLGIFLLSGAVDWKRADLVFTQGMRMMAMIGFIMISAQGFAAVMEKTGQIEPLVKNVTELFAGNKALAAFVMLLVGLIVTMGIGSSFSTLPIIAAIYVPLCISLGFSPLATVSLIGTAGALGDAGSPASDSTLGPTSGLNADGQHDHIRDSVIPTFLHFNLPLLLAGWVAALVL